MNKRIMAKTMSAVTALIMAASAMPIGVFAADSVQQAEGISGFSVCSSDDVNGFKTFAYETTDEEIDELLAQTQSYIKPTVKSRSAYKGAYDFSMGGAQYPRSIVAEKGTEYLEIYDKIDSAMSAFTNYGYESDVQPTKVNVSQSDGSLVEETHYYAVTVDVRDYKIPWTQENYEMIQQLMLTYLYANPQHYWNVNQVSVSGVSDGGGNVYVGSLNFPVYDKMIMGGTDNNGNESPRKAAKKAIESKIKEYQAIFAEIDGMSNSSNSSDDYSYHYIYQIHDKMCDEISYTSGDLNNSDAHTIVGSLAYGDCVCEGYAKAFSLLCNLAGVPTFMVTGNATNSSGNTEAHAWNLVQIGSSWYYMDATWNDGRNDCTYFLCGSQVMDTDHRFDNSETLVTSLPSGVSTINYEYTSGSEDPNAPSIIKDEDGTVYYRIETADDLIWFSEQVNSGKTINARLAYVIDMGGRDITPIGDNLGTQFRGIFDGQGYHIFNFTVGAAGNSPRYAGLFGIVGNGGVVKNLDIDQGTVNGGADISEEGTESCGAAGGIVGVVLGGAAIENCTNGGVSVTCEKGAAGGIVGRVASGATVKGCQNGVYDNPSSNDKVTGRIAGGIAGITRSDITFCNNRRKVCNTDPSDDESAVINGICGGIVGLADEGTYSISDCANSGNITCTDRSESSGGIAGSCKAALTVENCLNTEAPMNGHYDSIAFESDSGTVTVVNSYSVGFSILENVQQVDYDELKSGALAYKLGKNWRQYINDSYIENPRPVAPDLNYRDEEYNNRNKVFKLTFDDTVVYSNVNLYDSMTVMESAPAGKFWVSAETGHSAQYYYENNIEQDLTFTMKDVGVISEYTNMVIGESISYNFYCDVDDTLVKEVQAKTNISSAPELSVTANGETALVKCVGTAEINGKTMLKYSYGIPAKNLGDEMTAELIYDEKAAGSEKTASAKYYLMELYKANGKERALAAAMLNYAAQAQIYKNYNTENPANAELDESDKTIGYVKSADILSDEYVLTRKDGGNVTITSVSLNMLSQTRIRVYFKLDETAEAEAKDSDLYLVYIDSETGTRKAIRLRDITSGKDFASNDGMWGKRGDEYFFETTGISPLDYGKRKGFAFSFSGSTNDANFVGDMLNYGVYDYFASKCESTSSTGIAKLVSAMYAYSKACEDYSKN